jgi:hypothetical protein
MSRTPPCPALRCPLCSVVSADPVHCRPYGRATHPPFCVPAMRYLSVTHHIYKSHFYDSSS